MDLQHESSNLQSEESLDESRIESEDQITGETNQQAESIGSAPGVTRSNGDAAAADDTAEWPSNPNPEPRTAAPAPIKGYGLKKWRRIRRDSSRESAAVDGSGSGTNPKRRFPLAAESAKARDREDKHRSDARGEGSVASTTAIVTAAMDPELCSGFSVGADSDNSEDRSSRSSTAASAPRMRNDGIGFGRERSRGRVYGRRGSLQRGGGSGGGIDASKKFRGGRVGLEKENSLSSIESDLRSSNAAFIKMSNSAMSNGKQSERSVNYGGEHSDDARTSEEVRSGYDNHNGADWNSLREDGDEDTIEEENAGMRKNYRPSIDLDPFVDSIALLQVAQEALETEIQRFEQIRKEPITGESNVHLEGTEGSISPAAEAHFIKLNQKIDNLERKLEEASATVKAKESKMLELEAMINTTWKKSNESSDIFMLHQVQLELELECLLKRRIEVEIECLIIARSTQGSEALLKGQLELFEDQKTLLENQAEVMSKLHSAEDEALVLKKHAVELEANCGELLEKSEVLRLQNKVCWPFLCCFMQMVMLCFIIWWFLMQLLPLSDGVVPT